MDENGFRVPPFAGIELRHDIGLTPASMVTFGEYLLVEELDLAEIESLLDVRVEQLQKVL